MGGPIRRYGAVIFFSASLPRSLGRPSWPFSSSLVPFILVAVIWGLGNAFDYPALVAYSIDLAGSSRGPAIGTYMTFSDSGIGLGSVVMGIVLETTNDTVMFLCLSLMGVIDLFYFYSVLRRRRIGHAHL